MGDHCTLCEQHWIFRFVIHTTCCPPVCLHFEVLGELLIGFQDLIGEHSGENMAEAVWETLKQYGTENWVSVS